ncbi:Hsp70 family protein [Actinocatenispora rupis]|uniref:Hsp70 protein n=1 Tax=Actinocatenispora rupis TaxID=519421 RepID=A0A8J3J135_9ACTN|nr:Hsp70 family protein [Actinocatenispora rupis]GID13841.1 hypothetical protein Aru02nite_47300 [Actinocatenispora rupis]
MPTPALGIDFGTSTTIAVLRRADGTARPLLFDGTPLLPSALYLETDGRLLSGRDAVHSARLDPSRYEPSPKRRLNDGSVLLGDREVPVVELATAVLRRVAVEAARVHGSAVPDVTLTHPANWGSSRRDLLVEAARRAGLAHPRLVPEPVAAAHYFTDVLGHRIPVGSAVVVYDFGAGTFDASVVIRGTNGFETAVVDGLDVGGLDIDAAIVDWLGTRYGERDPAAWRRLGTPTGTAERRARELLWTDVRTCKEQLSRSSSARLAVPLLEVEAHLTRTEMEELAGPIVGETVRTTAGVIRHAGVTPDRIVGLFLVGGSSRLPLAGSQLHRRLGIPSTAIEQPEVVVGEGSLRVPTTEQGFSHTRILPVVAGPPSGPQGAPAHPIAHQSGWQQAGGYGPVSAPAGPAAAVSGTPAAVSGAPDSGGPVSDAPSSYAGHQPAARNAVVPAQQPAVARNAPAGQPLNAVAPAGQPLNAVAPARQQTNAVAPARQPAASRNAGVPAGRSANRSTGGGDRPASGPERRPPVYGAGSGTYRKGRRSGRRAMVLAVVVLLAAVLVAGGLYGYHRLNRPDGTGADAAGTDRRPGTPTFVPASWPLTVAAIGAGNGWHDNTSRDRTGTCRLADGSLSATKTKANPNGTGMFACNGPSATYGDVAVQTTVSVASGDAGVWLRTGDTEGYFLAVTADSVTLYVLGESGDPGPDTRLKRFALTGSGGDVRLGILAQGSQISVYQQDTRIGTLTDDQIASGRVDLGVFADGDRASASFTRTRLWSPA